MSLKDEMTLYTKLSGKDGNHTPIGIIGAYLDGYEKGKADQPHWIPCSERLPDDDVQVLCTDSEGFVYIASHCDYDIIEKTKCWCDVHYRSLPEDGIIAWMPLPEPYKEETNA